MLCHFKTILESAKFLFTYFALKASRHFAKYIELDHYLNHNDLFFLLHVLFENFFLNFMKLDL